LTTQKETTVTTDATKESTMTTVKPIVWVRPPKPFPSLVIAGGCSVYFKPDGDVQIGYDNVNQVEQAIRDGWTVVDPLVEMRRAEAVL
jgi:hypothetical protein